MLIVNTHEVVAPKPRNPQRRLSAELREISPSSTEAILLDPKTARCLVAHGRYKGWTMVQKQTQSGVLVWRLT